MTHEKIGHAAKYFGILGAKEREKLKRKINYNRKKTAKDFERRSKEIRKKME